MIGMTREYIDDEEDKKPEDWDQPQHIPDPDTRRNPEDWDDEMDGEWEPPQIDNPNYKGDLFPILSLLEISLSCKGRVEAEAGEESGLQRPVGASGD